MIALEIRRGWMFRAAREAQLILLRSSSGRIRERADIAEYLRHRVPKPASRAEAHVLIGLISQAELEFELHAMRFSLRLSRSVARRADDLLRRRFVEAWTIGRLAKYLGTNRFTLTTEFKSEYGVTVHQRLVSYRVEAAQQRLAAGQKRSAIAADVGFRSTKTLYDAFRRVTGRALREFLRPDPRQAEQPNISRASANDW
jgi:AraC-like DNA-binding protein